MNKNLSTSFLLPLIQLPMEELNLRDITLYVTPNHKSLVLIERIEKNAAKYVEESMEFYQKSPVHSLFYAEDTTIAVHFDVSPEMKTKVVDPFMKGQYSKMDSDYVENNFSQFVKSVGGVLESLNYQILKKSPELRTKWELMLDTTIDPEAELWDVPDKNKEYYGEAKEINFRLRISVPE